MRGTRHALPSALLVQLAVATSGCAAPLPGGLDDDEAGPTETTQDTGETSDAGEPFDPLVCGDWDPPAATPAGTPPSEQACAGELCPVFTEVGEAAGLGTLQYRQTHPANYECIFPRPSGASLSPFLDCEPQWFTGGASVGDLDGDGWPEIYMTRLAAPDHLFLNQGDGTFVDVAEQVGLGGCSWTNGVNFGDVDNDGDLDLLLTTVGDYSYQLWMNQLVETGALGFVEEGEARGFALSSPTMHSGESVTLGDYDRDGWLDLHVNEWLRLEQAPQPGDPGFASHRARLLRNTGGGYFLDRTEALGVDLWGADVDGTFAFSSTFADLDDDGWQDLAITVDFHRSRLFWNPGAEDPGGPFIDGSVAAKINRESNAMGSSFADVDLDGAFDWFVTSIAESRPCDIDEQPPCWAGSGNRLYRYFGAREFQLYTDLAGVRDAAWAWGASFFDADNDGDPDLAVANGWPGRDISGGLYHADTPMRLWLNQGVGVMSEEGEARGVDDRGQGRGLVSFDYDRDGDLDLLVINHAGQPRLLRNDGGNALPWLQVEVEGQVSNRDGRGAKIRVQVTVEGPTQIREVGVGSHFLGEGELVQHFGLGPDFDPALDRIYRVEVEWPASGAVQVFEQIEAGQRLQVLEAL